MKMNKIVALTFPAILISATLSAETLTYDNSAYGRFTTRTTGEAYSRLNPPTYYLPARKPEDMNSTQRRG